MASIKAIFRTFFQFYFAGAMAFGLWTAVFLSFRESCLFSSACAPLPKLNSYLLNIIISILPDPTPFALLMGVGRGLMWLPNMLIAIFTTRQSFFDWLFLRDVRDMGSFYRLIDSILP